MLCYVEDWYMKLKFFGVGLVLALLAVLVPMQPAGAAAYKAAFQVAVTYQNVGTADTAVSVTFYAENNATAIPFPIPGGNLAKGASSSLLIGSVGALPGSFKGSGIMSASQPIVATIVQLPPAGITVRPLSNGFSSNDGAATQLVATVLKSHFGSTTTFAVQNVEDAPVDVTVDFFGVTDAGVPTGKAATVKSPGLPSGAAKYFDAGDIAALGPSFNGSAVVTAKRTTGGAPAKTVITVNELDTVNNGAKSFEGTGLSSTTVYMASALCNFQASHQNTAYAVQNASTTGDATFTVTYSVNGQTGSFVDGPYTLTPGGKKSILGCGKMPDNSLGSAVIRRTGGTGQLVAVGKVSGGGISSAFLGATSGAAKLALPYVRWSPDVTFASTAKIHQRSFIAIQNIGTTDAKNVKVTYIDRDGKTLGTEDIGTIPPSAKRNSTPASGKALDTCGRFGEYGGNPPTDCFGTAFGGGAIVSADAGSQLTAVVRVVNGGPGAVLTAGEDYNGIAAP